MPRELCNQCWLCMQAPKQHCMPAGADAYECAMQVDGPSGLGPCQGKAAPPSGGSGSSRLSALSTHRRTSTMLSCSRCCSRCCCGCCCPSGPSCAAAAPGSCHPPALPGEEDAAARDEAALFEAGDCGRAADGLHDAKGGAATCSTTAWRRRAGAAAVAAASSAGGCLPGELRALAGASAGGPPRRRSHWRRPWHLAAPKAQRPRALGARATLRKGAGPRALRSLAPGFGVVARAAAAPAAP